MAADHPEAGGTIPPYSPRDSDVVSAQISPGTHTQRRHGESWSEATDRLVESPSLVEFLLARLDEREQTVRAAGECRIAWLTYRGEQGQMLYTTVAAHHSDDVWIAAGEELPASASALVVYETERELAEVETKRRIIEQHSPHGGYRPPDAWYGDQNKCQTCGGYTVAAGIGDRGYRAAWPCLTLRLLALPYADHPDYREEWKP